MKDTTATVRADPRVATWHHAIASADDTYVARATMIAFEDDRRGLPVDDARLLGRYGACSGGDVRLHGR